MHPLVVSENRSRGRSFCYQAPYLCNQSQYEFGRQTLSLSKSNLKTLSSIKIIGTNPQLSCHRHIGTQLFSLPSSVSTFIPGCLLLIQYYLTAGVLLLHHFLQVLVPLQLWHIDLLEDDILNGGHLLQFHLKVKVGKYFNTIEMSRVYSVELDQFKPKRSHHYT